MGFGEFNIVSGTAGTTPTGGPYVNAFTAPTWNLKSFNFDGTNNIFTGDAASTTLINNTITRSEERRVGKECRL